MSHGKERKEKNCLNCNAIVAGKYCQVCGQENLEPNENFWQLCTHFIYDIFHFDGQFFSTLKYLLFKPGFLTKEFFRGRRASYLHPFRMYLFTSAIFFLIYFTLKTTEDKLPEKLIATQQVEMLHHTIDVLKDSLRSTFDSATKIKIETQIKVLESSINFIMPKSNAEGNKETANSLELGPVKFNFNDSLKPKGENDFIKTGYKSIKDYDTLQARLPEDKRDGWLKKYMYKKSIEINEKYQGDVTGFWEKLKENFLHSLPKMLFVSLPYAALLLQLLYLRNKKFNYSNHSIFAVHVYITVFILMLASYAVSGFYDLLHWKIFSWINGLISLSIFFYIYKALRNYYGSNRIKTIVKYFSLLFLFAILFVLLIAVFFINSIIGM